MSDRVAVIGAALWSKRLARVLEVHGDIRCWPVSEIALADSWTLLGLIGSKTAIRVGFRPGQLRLRGLLIDLICLVYALSGGRLVFYWTGSDVERTVAMCQNGSGLSAIWGRRVAACLMGRASHWAAAPWLVKELKRVGVNAKCLPFPSPTEKFEHLAFERATKPERFSVLSYIPDHNFRNYCGAEIVNVARSLPNIDFFVMGGKGNWCQGKPRNLQFLGWTDASAQYLRSPLVVRAVRHDALGGTVREALLCGCHVVYTFPHEHTVQVELTGDPARDSEILASTIATYRDRYDSDQLEVNLEARQWVIDHLGEGKLASDIVGQLYAS